MNGLKGRRSQARDAEAAAGKPPIFLSGLGRSQGSVKSDDPSHRSKRCVKQTEQGRIGNGNSMLAKVHAVNSIAVTACPCMLKISLTPARLADLIRSAPPKDCLRPASGNVRPQAPKPTDGRIATQSRLTAGTQSRGSPLVFRACLLRVVTVSVIIRHVRVSGLRRSL